MTKNEGVCFKIRGSDKYDISLLRIEIIKNIQQKILNNDETFQIF